MSTTKTMKITGLAALALVAALAFTGCSGNSSTATSPAVTATAVTTEAPAPVETTPAVVAPVADANSAVIGGVLYQGTAIAPVRIGTDTPGAAPAAEAGFAANATWKDYVTTADKYAVSVGKGDGGWIWKVYGMSRYGSFRELGNSGYPEGVYLPSRAAALAGPFIVDGRTLDRSEYILATH